HRPLGSYLPGRDRQRPSTSIFTARLLDQRVLVAGITPSPVAAAETSSASGASLARLACHLATPPAVTCRTARPMTTRPSAVSTRRPAPMYGIGAVGRTRTASRSKSDP